MDFESIAFAEFRHPGVFSPDHDGTGTLKELAQTGH
jgi:hypothetical protein